MLSFDVEKLLYHSIAVIVFFILICMAYLVVEYSFVVAVLLVLILLASDNLATSCGHTC